MPTAQVYLNNNHKDKTVTELDLSGWNEEVWEKKPDWKKLTGELDLSSFPNLEKLDCSYNEITSLNLTNCPNLTELKCWDNQLTEIKLPTTLPNLKIFYAWTNYLTELDWKAFNYQSLTQISISNNNLKKQNIEVFSEFTNLEEIYVGNDIGERLEKENKVYNRFYGSTKSLKTLTKLKKLQIEGTEVSLLEEVKIISWGKEAVIKNLKLTKEEAEELRQTKSKDEFQKALNGVLINHAKKQLGLSLSLEEEKEIEELGRDIAANTQPKSTKLEEKIQTLNQCWKQLLEKQKEDKQNKMIAKTIPLERLYVIRGNIKQFLKKWGIKDSDTPSELIKLQSLQEINKNWWTNKKTIYTIQFVGRGAATVGAFLLFQNVQDYGGGILGIYPFSELLISNMEKSREDRKTKWKEFTEDIDTFSDNCNELLGILAPFKEDEKLRKGKINKTLIELNKEVKKFLEVYDKNHDNEISVEELISGKDELVKDLNYGEKSQIQKIAETIKHLEESITEYRKSSYYGTSQSKVEENSQIKSEEQVTTSEINSSVEVEEKIKQIKEKDQELEKQISKLKIKSKEAEISYLQIKEKIVEKQSDLLLLERQKWLTQEERRKTKEEMRSLKEGLDSLRQTLPSAEEKINRIREQLVRINFARLENQIKNLSNTNWWSSKINHGWEITWNGAKYCVAKTCGLLTTPYWYWEQWKNRKDVISESNLESKEVASVEEAEEKEDNEQEANNEHQKDESQPQTNDLDKHFEEKEQSETKIEINPK